MSEQALTIIRQQQEALETKPSPFIIRGRLKDQPLINLRKSWIRICKRAKIDGVRIHDLRHTAASIGVASGLTLPLIGRLLGHSQAQTTQRYAHVDNDPALIAANIIKNALAEVVKA